MEQRRSTRQGITKDRINPMEPESFCREHRVPTQTGTCPRSRPLKCIENPILTPLNTIQRTPRMYEKVRRCEDRFKADESAGLKLSSCPVGDIRVCEKRSAIYCDG